MNPQTVGVVVVVGAAFALWGAAPRLVTYGLLLILLVLLINKRDMISKMMGGAQQQQRPNPSQKTPYHPAW